LQYDQQITSKSPQRSRSYNTNIPQKKLVSTIVDDQVPTATAKPQVRIPYIPAHPPGTQNNPLTIPHFVNRKGSPIGIISQLVKKHIAVL
jgi:hypothetical protein